MQPVIRIRDLTKTYAGGFEALKSVDLDIDKGEIFGLLGPNGVGKTTMINIVCGIVMKTSGTVTVNGHKQVVSVQIKPEAVDPEDVETLDDLVFAALQSALSAAELAQMEGLDNVASDAVAADTSTCPP